MMNILDHSAQGATIQLDQRELLLVMALVQEGRAAFGCNTATGRALDELFSLANILVEEARRRSMKRPVTRRKIHLIAASEPASNMAASHR